MHRAEDVLVQTVVTVVETVATVVVAVVAVVAVTVVTTAIAANRVDVYFVGALLVGSVFFCTFAPAN